MHTKGFSLAAACLGLLGASSVALAQQRLYAGADVGNFKTENLQEHCQAQGIDECPDSVPYIRLKAGLHANDNFAVEAHFAWTQRMTANERSSATSAASSQLEYASYGFSGTGRVEILQGYIPGLYGYGRAGLHMWELKSGVSGNDQTGRSLLAALAEDGTDLMYGAGVQYLMSDRATIEAGYEDYNSSSRTDMGGFHLGLSYSF